MAQGDAAGEAGGELFEALVRASLDCIIAVDEAGRVVEFNPAAEAAFGHRRAESLGRPLAELIVPERHRAHHAAGMSRYLATGEARMLGRRIETEAITAEGVEFPVELAIAEVRQGTRRLFVASLRDLRPARAAEAARRESEARLEAFMANAPVGMYLKDSAGRYAMVNPEMAKVFGRPAGEVIGRDAAELFGPEEAAMIAGHDARVRASGVPDAVEEFLPGRDAYSWTLVMRFPVDRGDGGVEIGGFDIDISAIKAAEIELRRSREALAQAEKLAAMGSLLAGVSHELNNPLAAMIGQSVMLEEDLAGRPEATRAARVRAAAERCARIVQTFLAMARRRPPQRAPTDLNAVVTGALELADYQLRTAGVEVERRLAPDLPRLDADSDQLHQVLVNLIVNAQQALATVDGPRRLRVATRVEAGAVVAEIADNGPGVSAEVARRIFEPFFTTKPMGSGTGVGLSFAQGLIEAHGGSLTLVDAGPGACFRLTLPAGSGIAADGDTLAAAGPGPGWRVLVVDDEPDVAATLADLLRRDGHHPTVADGAAAARAALAAGRFDALLSDLRMPGEDGIALYRWLETAHPDLARRTLFVTGDTLGGHAASFLAGCGRPVLEKPFTPASLRAAMAELAA